MWLARVHPEDRDNVRAELDMVINGTWHFHYMQYRVMDATGKYVLCDCTGYRLDGTDTEPGSVCGHYHQPKLGRYDRFRDRLGRYSRPGQRH